MSRTEVYGTRLDEHWRGQCTVTSLLVKGRARSDITVARLTGGPGFGLVEPVPAEEGYAVTVELIDYQQGELWLGGRSSVQTELRRNHSVFYDLRRRCGSLQHRSRRGRDGCGHSRADIRAVFSRQP